jgi:ribosomal protein S18 acetylase RimI-like enzyme
MLLLRPATPHDLAALHAIERSATELYYEAGFARTAIDPRSPADVRLLLKYTTVLLACDGDDAIGYVSYHARGPFLHLEEIAVRRDRQRRGCGLALAQQYLAAAQADPQCSHLSLLTFVEARWAVNLYTRLGFQFLAPDADLPQLGLLRELVALESCALEAGRTHPPEARMPMVRPVDRTRP